MDGTILARTRFARSLLTVMPLLGMLLWAEGAAAQALIVYPNETEFHGVAKWNPLNGHWYVAGRKTKNWHDAKTFAENTAFGNKYRGHLATFTSLEENAWVRYNLQFATTYHWAGGYHASGRPEDRLSGWVWVTGERWFYSNWASQRPNSDAETGLEYVSSSGLWRDAAVTTARPPIIEFAIPMRPISQPVVNRESLSAYELASATRSWDAARAEAAGREFWGFPGHLATVRSDPEGQFITSRLDFTTMPIVWAGAQRIPGSPDPREGWEWITGEPWDYPRWVIGEPEDATSDGETALTFHGTGIWGFGDEVPDRNLPYLIEYTARPPSPDDNAVLAFDGKYMQAAVADSATFAIPYGFTVEVWARPESSEQLLQVLVSNNGSYAIGARGFALYLLDDGEDGYVPVFSVAGKGLVQAATRLHHQEWRHLAVVLDGAQLRLHVDGQVVAEAATMSSPISDSTAPIVVGIGLAGGQGHFRGLLDEIRIWNLARSRQELLDSYPEVLPAETTGLFAHYPVEAKDENLADDHAGGGHPLVPTGAAPEEWTAPVRMVGALALSSPLNLVVSAEIVPGSPSSWDDLTCQVNLVNSGNHSLRFSYEWFRNGEKLTTPLQVDGEVLSTTAVRLAGAYTRRGDRFVCRVRISEGSSFRLRTTPEVVIQNGVPSAPEVKIVPENPEPWDGLGCEFLRYSVDPDGDPIGYEINWYRSRDGGETWVHRIEVSGILPQGVWVPPAFLREGDLWRVEAIAFERVASKPGGEVGRGGRGGRHGAGAGRDLLGPGVRRRQPAAERRDSGARAGRGAGRALDAALLARRRPGRRRGKRQPLVQRCLRSGRGTVDCCRPAGDREPGLGPHLGRKPGAFAGPERGRGRGFTRPGGFGGTLGRAAHREPLSDHRAGF